MNTCPMCEAQAEEIETINPILNGEGMMVPVPRKYFVCTGCKLEYSDGPQIDFNARQAHLLLNQHSTLDKPC